MSDATKVIDGSTANSGGGTTSGTFDTTRSDVKYKLYINGDGDSGNLDLDVDVELQELSDKYREQSVSRSGMDVTQNSDNSLVITLAERLPRGTITLTFTNQGGSNTTITVHAKRVTA